MLNDGGTSDHLGLVVELCSFGPAMQFHAKSHGCCRFSPGHAALTLPMPKQATRSSAETTSSAESARTTGSTTTTAADTTDSACNDSDLGNYAKTTQHGDEEEKNEEAAPLCPAVSAEDELSWGLPPLLAAKWGRDLLRGVAYLHEMGVAHRDLKVSCFDGFCSGWCFKNCDGGGR